MSKMPISVNHSVENMCSITIPNDISNDTMSDKMIVVKQLGNEWSESAESDRPTYGTFNVCENTVILLSV